jgi:pyrrolidone-carboxylate peptidase
MPAVKQTFYFGGGGGKTTISNEQLAMNNEQLAVKDRQSGKAPICRVIKGRCLEKALAVREGCVINAAAASIMEDSLPVKGL